ncbi:hypothetical protein BXZ70DRAFT_912201 [Cristinia sonorae]|uniref:F-box domain-containing protein n=1 Tax=Cristinia sonorae TaxID=1940300 RepID=A0A8K0UXM6_9AGAR|nr:hypothetical protein BXZ70DRAFT_912201 [Cristinia sonorae]
MTWNGFKGLPNELLELVLLQADLQTIMRFKRVSRPFKRLVDHSTRLQLRIEQMVEGLEDGAPGTMSAVQRLDAIRQRRKAWSTFRFTYRKYFYVPDGELHSFYGDHFAWTSDGSTKLNILQVPSDIRCIPEKCWQVDLPEMKHLHDLAVDPDQDILLLIEEREDWVLHLLSLSSGEAHPRSQKPVLAVDGITLIPALERSELSVVVFQRYLICVASSDTRERELLLFDWNTGDRLLHVVAKGPLSYAFLSEQYFMIGHDKKKSPFTLSIIDTNTFKPTTSKVRVRDLNSCCKLNFPEKSGVFAAHEVTTDWGAPRPWQNHQYPVPYCSGEERLFTVNVAYEEESWNEDFSLFVPLSTLMRCVKEAGTKPRVFEWEEWGPSGTHFLCSAENETRLEHYSSDSMWAVGFDMFPTSTTLSEKLMITLYDFAQLSNRRYVKELLDEVQATGQAITAGLCAEHQYGASRIFKDQNIVSRFPARIFERWVPLGNGRNESQLLYIVPAEDCLFMEFGVSALSHSHFFFVH